MVWWRWGLGLLPVVFPFFEDEASSLELFRQLFNAEFWKAASITPVTLQRRLHAIVHAMRRVDEQIWRQYQKPVVHEVDDVLEPLGCDSAEEHEDVAFLIAILVEVFFELHPASRTPHDVAKE